MTNNITACEWSSKQGKGLYRLELQNVAVGRSFLIGLDVWVWVDRDKESGRNNGVSVRWDFAIYHFLHYQSIYNKNRSVSQSACRAFFTRILQAPEDLLKWLVSPQIRHLVNLPHIVHRHSPRQNLSFRIHLQSLRSTFSVWTLLDLSDSCKSVTKTNKFDTTLH